MMLKSTLAATLLALSATALLAPAARAATDEQRAAMKQKWDSMTPEEKAAAKEKLKAKWDAMTPEERKDFLQKHPQAARMMARREGAASSAPAGK